MRITTSNPRTTPSVEWPQLTEQQDIVRLREGARRLLEFVYHPAITGLVDKTFVNRHARNFETFAEETQIDQWIRREYRACLYLAGTCRMGAANDSESVVDPTGSVVGVEGLRIGDASIMPTLPRAIPYLSSIMIAEHIARDIV